MRVRMNQTISQSTVVLEHYLPPPRQNAVRMSKELSFRSVTHFRLRIEIIGKQIKLPHHEVQNQKVRLRKEK